MPSPSSPSVQLPSIHEMFPEHLIPPQKSKCSSYHSSPSPSSSETSIRAKNSDRMNHASFSHRQGPNQDEIAASISNGTSPAFRVVVDPQSRPVHRRPHSNSHPHPPPSYPYHQTRPRAHTNPQPPSSSSSSSAHSFQIERDSETSDSAKRHICPTCYKRFNRPSSLRIHVNTHTGATPFRCPYPNCGREFNVNSNMRRHYRNHTSEPPRTTKKVEVYHETVDSDSDSNSMDMDVDTVSVDSRDEPSFRLRAVAKFPPPPYRQYYAQSDLRGGARSPSMDSE